MNGFLEGVAGIVRELLPSKDAPTSVWVAKVSVLLVALFGSAGIGYYALSDTQWAADRGLRKIIHTPAQTVIDQVQRRRKIFAEMGKVFASDPNVYSIFVINAYDPTKEEFNYKDPSKNTKLLIRFSRLRNDVDYYAFNTLETLFESRFKDSPQTKACVWGAISPNDKYVLARILGSEFDSDWYGMCPIYHQGVPTIATLVFYKQYEKTTPYDDSESLFRLRFAAFSEEVHNIIFAPANSFAWIGHGKSPTLPAKAAKITPIGF